MIPTIISPRYATTTGKSTHAAMIVSTSPIPLRHINVGDLVKEHSLHNGFDEEWQSYIVDEDKVIFARILSSTIDINARFERI